jgi:hypothetical protein
MDRSANKADFKADLCVGVLVAPAESKNKTLEQWGAVFGKIAKDNLFVLFAVTNFYNTCSFG